MPCPYGYPHCDVGTSEAEGGMLKRKVKGENGNSPFTFHLIYYLYSVLCTLYSIICTLYSLLYNFLAVDDVDAVVGLVHPAAG